LSYWYFLFPYKLENSKRTYSRDDDVYSVNTQEYLGTVKPPIDQLKSVKNITERELNADNTLDGIEVRRVPKNTQGKPPPTVCGHVYRDSDGYIQFEIDNCDN